MPEVALRDLRPGCDPAAIGTVATMSPVRASKPLMEWVPRLATQTVP